MNKKPKNKLTANNFSMFRTIVNNRALTFIVIVLLAFGVLFKNQGVFDSHNIHIIAFLIIFSILPLWNIYPYTTVLDKEWHKFNVLKRIKIPKLLRVFLYGKQNELNIITAIFQIMVSSFFVLCGFIYLVYILDIFVSAEIFSSKTWLAIFLIIPFVAVLFSLLEKVYIFASAKYFANNGDVYYKEHMEGNRRFTFIKDCIQEAKDSKEFVKNMKHIKEFKWQIDAEKDVKKWATYKERATMYIPKSDVDKLKEFILQKHKHCTYMISCDEKGKCWFELISKHDNKLLLSLPIKNNL